METSSIFLLRSVDVSHSALGLKVATVQISVFTLLNHGSVGSGPRPPGRTMVCWSDAHFTPVVLVCCNLKSLRVRTKRDRTHAQFSLLSVQPHVRLLSTSSLLSSFCPRCPREVIRCYSSSDRVVLVLLSFRTGPGQVHPQPYLLQRGRDALVPASGCAAGIHGLLHLPGHVVRILLSSDPRDPLMPSSLLV